MENRENYLRAIEFRHPEWIPSSLGLSFATWHKYREKLEDLVLRHPMLFRDFNKRSVFLKFDKFPPAYRKGEYFRDNWGCLWISVQAGVEGQVVEHPLADWKALDTYKPPDISKTERQERDWKKTRKTIEERRKKGLLTGGGGDIEGNCDTRLFDRLMFLRGFKNLMIDFASDDPHLPRLIDMLWDYEAKLIEKWLEIGVDILYFHTDIGSQNGLMISPKMFRKYLKPMFKDLFTACRKADTHVWLSSDGRILDIVDDLVECGVSVHDPQLRANTLEGIEKTYKGKMCACVDLDRQMFPFCKPKDIRQQVKEVVERLYLPQGGLMLGTLILGDVSLENIETICLAMEEFMFYRK